MSFRLIPAAERLALPPGQAGSQQKTHDKVALDIIIIIIIIIIMRISKAPHLLRKIAAQGAYKSNLKTNMTHTKKKKKKKKCMYSCIYIYVSPPTLILAPYLSMLPMTSVSICFICDIFSDCFCHNIVMLIVSFTSSSVFSVLILCTTVSLRVFVTSFRLVVW